MICEKCGNHKLYTHLGVCEECDRKIIRGVCVKLEDKLALLENSIAPTGKIPGTIISRVFAQNPYGGIKWSLGVGLMGDVKRFFHGDTIEECVDAAIKWISDGMQE